MQTLTVDDNVATALAKAEGLVEVKGRDGRVVGFFAPPDGRDALLRSHLFRTVDPEQVRRQKDTPERTYTTDEVKAHLRSLGDRG